MYRTKKGRLLKYIPNTINRLVLKFCEDRETLIVHIWSFIIYCMIILTVSETLEMKNLGKSLEGAPFKSN